MSVEFCRTQTLEQLREWRKNLVYRTQTLDRLRKYYSPAERQDIDQVIQNIDQVIREGSYSV